MAFTKRATLSFNACGTADFTICSLAFSQDGSQLAALSTDRLATWRITNREEEQQDFPYFQHLANDFDAYGITFSPNGETLATAMVAGVGLWIPQIDDEPDKKLLTSSSDRNTFRCVAYSPSGRFVAAGSADGYIHIWEEGKIEPGIFQGHSDAIHTIRWITENGLITASDCGFAKKWEYKGDDLFQVEDAACDTFWTTAVSECGEFVACSGGDDQPNIDVYDFRGTQSIKRKTLASCMGSVTAMAVTEKHHALVAADYDGAVRMWDTRCWQCMEHGRAPFSPVNALAISQLDGLIAVGGDDSTIELWELPS